MQDTVHGTGGQGGHAHHWEVSWAPMAIAFGAMFLVPLTFASVLVYKSLLAGIICAGLGVPLLLAGIAKWIHEGATQHAVIERVSPIGVGVFIVGEILIFLGLFAAYWTLRLSTGVDWPPAGTPAINKALPLIMTAILVASSLTYHHCEAKFEAKDRAGFTKWLLISIVLGAAFLGCTIYEYGHLFHEGFTPGTNQYSAAFYSLTGFHAAHVLIGICSFLALLIGFATSKVSPMFVKVAGIYWHFVDVVWFFVASQVYYW